MSGDLDKEAYQAFEMMAGAMGDMNRSRGEAPAPVSMFDPPPGHIWCACKKKAIHATDVRVVDSGVIKARDSLCRECLVDVQDFSIIVCLECKDVVGRLKPHVMKGGFRFEKRTCYHVEACPNCKPDIERSKVIEHILFAK